MKKQSKLFPRKEYDTRELALIVADKKMFGFTGSRKRFKEEDKKKVESVIDILPNGAVVISGKCSSSVVDADGNTRKNENTDRWAVARAVKRGLDVFEFEPSYPDLERLKKEVKDGNADPRKLLWYIAGKNYERNQRIVNESEILFAVLPEKNIETRGKRKGGTWDTVKRALRAGIPVYANEKGSNSWKKIGKTDLLR